MAAYDWPRLHAALNDLPAALLLAAVAFDLLAAFTRREGLRQAGFWTLILGALGGGLAVLSGLQAEDEIAHGGAVHEVMETHELLALITLGVFTVLAVWRLLRETRMMSVERTGARLFSLVGLGFLLATASYGGRLVFDHAAGIPTDVLQAEIADRARSDHHHGGGDDDHDHPAPTAAPDTASANAAADTAATRAPIGVGGHDHPPGTAPHQH